MFNVTTSIRQFDSMIIFTLLWMSLLFVAYRNAHKVAQSPCYKICFFLGCQQCVCVPLCPCWGKKSSTPTFPTPTNLSLSVFPPSQFAVMPRFAEQVEVAIEALSTNPPQPFEENEFIDASRLVYDGVRDIRKAVLMIRVRAPSLCRSIAAAKRDESAEEQVRRIQRTSPRNSRRRQRLFKISWNISCLTWSPL